MSMLTTGKRIARYGFIGFIRNGFVSLTAILIMTIALFVLSGFMIFGAALSAVLAQLTDKVDVTVYFMPTASSDQVTSMQNSLRALPEVSAVTYQSPDQALSDFRERHKNDQVELQALDVLGENPFGSALEIKAKETSQYETIANYIHTQETNSSNLAAAIHDVNFYENKTAIDRLSNIIQTSREVGIGLAIVLGLATILIVFNTIRLAIYTARDEIGVMNLVGASHWYVRGPFVISGILYGVISALIVLITLYPLTAWLGPGSERFFGTFNVFSYFVATFPLLFLVVMGSGVALGALSSYLAVRRYLHVNG
jgi:cell division transport system permease protein